MYIHMWILGRESIEARIGSLGMRGCCGYTMGIDWLLQAAQAYAQDVGLQYLETSAKTGQNCQELLTIVSETMFARKGR